MMTEEYTLKKLRKTEEFQSFSQEEWEDFLSSYYKGDFSPTQWALYQTAIQKTNFQPNYTKEPPES